MECRPQITDLPTVIVTGIQLAKARRLHCHGLEKIGCPWEELRHVEISEGCRYRCVY